MKTLMWVLVGLMAQLAFAVFVAKCMHIGAGASALNAVKDPDDPQDMDYETAPVHAATESYADLAALMKALDPQPEKAVVNEQEPQSAYRQADPA